MVFAMTGLCVTKCPVSIVPHLTYTSIDRPPGYFLVFNILWPLIIVFSLLNILVCGHYCRHSVACGCHVKTEKLLDTQRERTHTGFMCGRTQKARSTRARFFTVLTTNSILIIVFLFCQECTKSFLQKWKNSAKKAPVGNRTGSNKQGWFDIYIYIIHKVSCTSTHSCIRFMFCAYMLWQNFTKLEQKTQTEDPNLVEVQTMCKGDVGTSRLDSNACKTETCWGSGVA